MEAELPYTLLSPRMKIYFQARSIESPAQGIKILIDIN
jgi:hypothetical protein